jgi:hypothetical protein
MLGAVQNVLSFHSGDIVDFVDFDDGKGAVGRHIQRHANDDQFEPS